MALNLNGEVQARPGAVAIQGRDSAVRRFYRRRKAGINLIISIVLAVVAWQVAAQYTSRLVLVPLEDVYQALLRRVESGQFWVDVLATARSFGIGLMLSAVIGIILGIAMATNELIHDIFDPWVSALYSTPLIALAPLFIIVFGIGLSSKVAVVFLLAIVPVIINTSAGIRTADPSLIEGAYSFGASKSQIFRKVLIPSAVPFIVAGLRVAIGRGLTGVVVAEFVGARAGLGRMIFDASHEFQTATVYLGVTILAVIGTVLLKLMSRLEQRLTPWKEFRMP